jgi:ANTAR domain-containing protein/GAF domain-containing protein
MTADRMEWQRDKEDFVARSGEAVPLGNDSGHSPLARAFAEFSRRLLSSGTAADALSHVATAALEVLPEADLVSVTLRSRDGHLHTPVATEPLGTELDRLQDQFQEGPCFDAAHSPGPAYRYSGELAEDPDWPRFGAAAAGHGVHSALSTALLPDDRPAHMTGALNVFSRTPHALGGETDRDRALLLASHAALAVSTTEAVRLAELRETQLREAIDSRDLIGQAKGILMNRRGISADEAFELLRRTSQDLNVKLAEIARTITQRHAEL